MERLFNIADLKDPSDPRGRSYREINNAAEHKYNVGQLVEFEDGLRLFITKQTRDCDGTPLYWFGWGEKTVRRNYPEDGFKIL